MSELFHGVDIGDTEVTRNKELKANKFCTLRHCNKTIIGQKFKETQNCCQLNTYAQNFHVRLIKSRNISLRNC